MDTLSKAERSELMSRVRAKDSVPELALRRLVHGMGFRYRLHGRDLPGNPDLVFPARNAVIFMHGCFWHRHANCRRARMPKTRIAFWTEKLEGNRRRDRRNHRKLRVMGWRVLVVWECQLNDPEKVSILVCNFLNNE